MKPFAELARSKAYWLSHVQNKLYAAVERFCRARGWQPQQLVEHLGYSKGYVRQVMNGDFDRRLSKLIELSLAVGMVPDLQFRPIDEYVASYVGNRDSGPDTAAATVTFIVDQTTFRPTPKQLSIARAPGVLWQPGQPFYAFA